MGLWDTRPLAHLDDGTALLALGLSHKGTFLLMFLLFSLLDLSLCVCVCVFFPHSPLPPCYIMYDAWASGRSGGSQGHWLCLPFTAHGECVSSSSLSSGRLSPQSPITSRRLLLDLPCYHHRYPSLPRKASDTITMTANILRKGYEIENSNIL